MGKRVQPSKRMPEVSETERLTLADAHRHFACAFNSEVWALLSKTDRSDEDEASIVSSAHASLRHWAEIGTAANRQRGEWLVSHVYAMLGRPNGALHHGLRCLKLTQDHMDEMKDFDIAYAFEAMARAHALAGDEKAAGEFDAKARTAGKRIKDEKNRTVFFEDLATR